MRAHLDAGVDPNTPRDDGYLSLKPNPNLAPSLTLPTPNPNLIGFTALMTAAEAGHAEVVTLLRTVAACHVDAKNAYGHAACQSRQDGLLRAGLRWLRARWALWGGAAAPLDPAQTSLLTSRPGRAALCRAERPRCGGGRTAH